jgi:soluble lytic murein transglycosylase
VEKFNQENLIKQQEKRIQELEEKLKIFKIIEDFQVGLSTDEVGELTRVITRESEKYNYDPLLIIALIQTESSFKRNQQSHLGAMGLMQLRPFVGYDVAKRKGLTWSGKMSLFDPDFNIQLGSLYLFELILKFQDVRKAIIAYNFGENALRLRMKEGGDLPKIFLSRVVNHYKKLKEKYAKIAV